MRGHEDMQAKVSINAVAEHLALAVARARRAGPDEVKFPVMVEEILVGVADDHCVGIELLVYLGDCSVVLDGCNRAVSP